MPQRFRPRNARGRTIASPIKPGTPLYRVLEMIAQAIVKDLQGAKPTRTERRRSR